MGLYAGYFAENFHLDPSGTTAGPYPAGYVEHKAEEARKKRAMEEKCKNPKGKCGLEIGPYLKAIEKKLTKAFENASKKTQEKVCSSMISKLGAVAAIGKGWDIKELAFNKKKFMGQGCGTGSCNVWNYAEGRDGKANDPIGTVTINGKCYRPAEANYWLWGLANKLCYKDYGSPDYTQIEHGKWTTHEIERTGTHTLKHAKELVSLYRTVFYGGAGAEGRSAWTEAGYNGKFEAPSAELKGCTPCDKKYTGTLNVHIGTGTVKDGGRIEVKVGPEDLAK